MIKIELATEPPSFDGDVRQRGEAFLATIPAGASVEFDGREYWRNCLLDLHTAYSSICAYTAHWIPLDVGSDTVEHFIAKSAQPNLAYEWDNFRLVCSRLNARKGLHTDVVDPFCITEGMFELDFPSLQIRPGTQVPAQNAALATTTIARLKLNDERSVRSRQAYVEEFRDGHISFNYLQRHAPFLALEIERQGHRHNLNTVMRPV